MSFATELKATKEGYPFDRWHEGYENGLEQYTKENCDRARAIFDKLIGDLISLGPDATDKQKLAKFKAAVIALNDLNEELDECFIETGEREELCELCNAICSAAGMDPAKYGDGEGPASEWREW